MYTRKKSNPVVTKKTGKCRDCPTLIVMNPNYKGKNNLCVVCAKRVKAKSKPAKHVPPLIKLGKIPTQHNNGNNTKKKPFKKSESYGTPVMRDNHKIKDSKVTDRKWDELLAFSKKLQGKT